MENQDFTRCVGELRSGLNSVWWGLKEKPETRFLEVVVEDEAGQIGDGFGSSEASLRDVAES